MISDEVSRLYFKRTDYDSLDDLFSDVGKQMKILLNTSNTVIFYPLQDVAGIYVLEFSPLGLEHIYEETKFPTWLTSKELTAVQFSRISHKIEDIDKTKEELEDAKDEVESILTDSKTNKPKGDA